MTPDELDHLKTAADEALVRWKRQIGRELDLACPGDFEEFLDAVDFGYPDSEERAVAIALAIVADQDVWPPPDGFLTDVQALLRNSLPDDPQRALRAHEGVVAYTVGWRRSRVDWLSHGWDGILPRAKEVLKREVCKHVDECLTFLEHYVEGFPGSEDRGKWADKVLNVFLARRGRCQCWTRVLDVMPPHPANLDPDTLKGNAKKKAVTCLAQHSIGSWDPAQQTPRGVPWTLWMFVKRAVKGCLSGSLRAASFPTGMLFDRLLHEKEVDAEYGVGYGLRRVKAAQHYCERCDKWGVSSTCSCGADLSPQQARVRSVREHLIVEDERLGGYRPFQVWTCANCGNVYCAQKCIGGCSAGDDHDQCPLCHADHPMPDDKKKPRTSTVYFFQFGPSPHTVHLGMHPPAANQTAAPDHSHLPLSEAVLAARDEFSAGYKVGLLDWAYWCVQDGDFACLGLFSASYPLDWVALHAALGTYCDCPATPEELHKAFDEQMKECLERILKETLEDHGFDWSAFLNHQRPTGREEGGISNA